MRGVQNTAQDFVRYRVGQELSADVAPLVDRAIDAAPFSRRKIVGNTHSAGQLRLAAIAALGCNTHSLKTPFLMRSGSSASVAARAGAGSHPAALARIACNWRTPSVSDA